MSKTLIDWDKRVSEAHLHSWPTATFSVQNVNPSPSQGSRNIFKDDEKQILEAARKYGYVRLAGSGPIVSFRRLREFAP